MKDAANTTPDEPKASATPEAVPLEVGKDYLHRPTSTVGTLERLDAQGNPYLRGLAGPLAPADLGPLN